RALEIAPRALLHLLQAQLDALAAAADRQDLEVDHLADLQELAGMLDAPVREVRDVQQALDVLADRDERAVFLDARDAALHGLAGLELVDRALALALALALQHDAPRDGHARALAVDLDDLARQHLADEQVELLVARQPGLRLGHERVQRTDLDLE